MKLIDAKKHIQQIAKEALNDEQKKIANIILDKVAINDEVDDKFISFIEPNIKCGFVFDKAPEVEQDNIALLIENKNLKITSKKSLLNHYLMIGENYEVLKNLQLVYTKIENGQKIGCIDVIYIDPPYNTERSSLDGNNYKDKVESTKFIYRDKFRRTGWLNMMNERLKLARDLLSPTGVIFISIDDNEQAYLKVLCDEIFGEDNFVCNFIWKKKNSPSGNTTLQAGIDVQTEYILMYAKSIQKIQLNKRKYIQDELKKYTYKDEFYNLRGKYKLTPLMHTCTAGAFQYIKSLDYEIQAPDGTYFQNHENIKKPKSCCYTWSKKLFDFGYKNGFIDIQKKWDKTLRKNVYIAYRKVYEKCMIDNKKFELIYQSRSATYTNFISTESIDKITTSVASNDLTKILGDKIFPFPKPTSLIKYLIQIVNNKNSIVLDFFAGSGTTGQAVMELNQEDGGRRKFILCTNNENNIAKDICWERLYRVINGIGSNGQKIDWKYTKQLPSLSNNIVSTFEIKHYKCGIMEDCQKLFDITTRELKKLNEHFNLTGISLARALSSLHPFNINKE